MAVATAPARAALPSLGDRARLLALFDAAFEMPLSRLELFERDYPCAPETLRVWARANGQQLEMIGGGLRLRIAGRMTISVYLADPEAS